MADSKDWDRLGAVVLNWRARLGLSRKELGDRMGKDAKTVARVEQGRSVYATTLAALEIALGWEPGSALAVLRGGTPLGSARVPTLDELTKMPVADVARVIARVRELNGDAAAQQFRDDLIAYMDRASKRADV